MSKISKAVQLIEQIATDNSHGYLWGGWGPDFDCGHLIIHVLEESGIPVKTAGASYTGNMRRVFLSCGAKDVTAQVNLKTGAGMKAGDVLVNEANHAAMYVGNGRIVQARSNFDGKTGDSSGQEIREQNYYNYSPGGWDCVLRFEDDSQTQTDAAAPEIAVAPQISGLPVLRFGSRGAAVEAAQLLLIGRGYSCGGDIAIDGREDPDGVFGPVMFASVIRWQQDHDLDDDGIIGPATWAALLGVS